MVRLARVELVTYLLKVFRQSEPFETMLSTGYLKKASTKSLSINTFYCSGSD
jgi:hypothetical protein